MCRGLRDGLNSVGDSLGEYSVLTSTGERHGSGGYDDDVELGDFDEELRPHYQYFLLLDCKKSEKKAPTVTEKSHPSNVGRSSSSSEPVTNPFHQPNLPSDWAPKDVRKYHSACNLERIIEADLEIELTNMYVKSPSLGAIVRTKHLFSTPMISPIGKEMPDVVQCTIYNSGGEIFDDFEREKEETSFSFEVNFQFKFK